MYHLYRSHPHRDYFPATSDELASPALQENVHGWTGSCPVSWGAETTAVMIHDITDIHSKEPSSGVRFMRQASAEAVGEQAAQRVAEQLRRKPDSSIVFPTGNTPLPLYRALRAMKTVDWRQARLFQLDEYLSPHPERPLAYESFAAYMDRELWAHVAGQKFYIQDYLNDPAGYEGLVLKDNGPDLVLLGIGANGHVAFNEPGSQPDSPTRVIDLTEETLRSNFSGLDRAECPKQALSMGLKAILSAGEIILMATGQGKKDVIERAFNPENPPTLDCPASWLKDHPQTLILTDFEVFFPVD